MGNSPSNQTILRKPFGCRSFSRPPPHFSTALHKDLNWDYAKYQAEKIEKAIKLGLERRPKRAESAKVFLSEDLPIVLQAVQAKDKGGFGKAMDRLRSACMQCHVREKVPYFTVYLPERRISPVRPGP